MSAASLKELREVIRAVPHGALSTHRALEERDLEGYPQGSAVLIAADQQAHPILLISTLADHTKNLAADARCSLLLVPEAGADSQRLTLFGRATAIEETADIRVRYLSRHPGAAIYVDFGDFAFYRLTVETAYWVGGFGKQRWVKAKDVVPAVPEELQSAEAGIVGHMNEDHLDAMADMAAARGFGSGPWSMCGIDPDGFDLVSEASGWRRIRFESPIADASEARAQLVALTKAARSRAV